METSAIPELSVCFDLCLELRAALMGCKSIPQFSLSRSDPKPKQTLGWRLRTLFSEEEAVRLGYVFGSQVDGNTGPLSDLDVTVLAQA